jgi:hypothetical protein
MMVQREPADAPHASSAVSRVLRAILELQIGRPGLVLCFVAGMTIPCLLLALRLDLKTDFAELPITVGIGADYAINVLRRYQLEGASGLQKVMVETGGAVALCSLTTILGYSALLLSINQAITSFGSTAAFGEVACLTVALLVVPSAIIGWGSRRAHAAGGEIDQGDSLRRSDRGS